MYKSVRCHYRIAYSDHCYNVHTRTFMEISAPGMHRNDNAAQTHIKKSGQNCPDFFVSYFKTSPCQHLLP